MSWGHATSTDLLHWTEQPLAIPQDADADIFSGSIVVDHDNTSGFGTAENPPLVAMYTTAYHTGEQAQSTRLQHGRRADLDQIRRQPGHRPQLQQLP